jgi:uncharacterized protein with HEPN domain
LGDVANNTLDHIIDDYKVVASIINCFYSKLLSDGENAQQVATDMKIKIEQSNYSNLNKYWNSFIEEHFNKVEAVTINDFSKLDMETLKNKITYGSYQLKIA